MSTPELWVGLDVGSVTVKLAVVEPSSQTLLHSEYRRHGARQAQTAQGLLKTAHERFPNATFRLAVAGSGGAGIAELLEAFFIQEVVANSLAVQTFYPQARVAIELGGEDAKVVFFRHDEALGQLVASDMRMNGSCAGGTGAFIDQVATLLGVSAEQFGEMASKGARVYEISGRCGVFAKTDIQPLLNQCAAKEDIALSTFHAVAKQTIGGLVQGMTVHPPVVFEGGPLTFNPKLIEVFAERLGLSEEQILVPSRPELMVALGAALSLGRLFADKTPRYEPSHLGKLSQPRRSETHEQAAPFFADEAERAAFEERHKLPAFAARPYEYGSTVRAFLGIDAGSTTSKFVLLDEQGEVIDKFYAGNGGDPLRLVTRALLELRNTYRKRGLNLEILGAGATGYGEQLFAAAYHADFHTVETVAHAEAARHYVPDVSFVLDIGGQDMKAIWVGDQTVTGITLNEACSAGCGSFIETLAASLKVPVPEVAEAAFRSKSPSRLGSRCTVFMNSSTITEQKNGKSVDDILAGVARSVVENVFTKVVRLSNFDALGKVACVQGGTLKNDAVLRALEQITGRTVVRPPHPAEMGAIGVALLTKRAWEESARQRSRFIGFDRLESFDFEKLPASTCRFCTNLCSRSLVRFNDGTHFITGHRCERGEILGDPKDPATREQVRAAKARMDSVADLTKRREELLFQDWKPARVAPEKKVRIGLPRTLEFWNSMPFWSTLFRALGFEVVLSRPSNYGLFEEGLPSVPSDTVCFPAKLVHGHVKDLIAKKVDRIFMPMMVKIPAENAGSGVHVCAVIQGYPVIIEQSDEPQARHGVGFDRPIFHWYDLARRDRQIRDFFQSTYGCGASELKAALKEADRAQDAFEAELLDEGRKVLDALSGEQFAVVLAGRPYHGDSLVNHDLAGHFTRLGVPVLTVDALPDLHDADLSKVRSETVNPFHVRMFGAAMAVAAHPNLELVQVVSFGCGHDAVISDEMARILKHTADKPLLTLKLDEGEAKGPLNIRVKSFVETTRARRRRDLQTGRVQQLRELPDPFPVSFQKEDKERRTVMVPNISKPFAEVMTAVISRRGYKLEPLPLAGPRAIELGKRYLHNDICFPAQINVGEFLAMAESGKYKPEQVALGLAKNCDDCRAGQYAGLARQALDDAGYANVPIVTTGSDNKNMHPGFKLGVTDQLRTLWGLALMDAMDDMLRKTRPYEVHAGEADRVFEQTFAAIVAGMSTDTDLALAAFEQAVDAFNAIEVRREVRKPRVFIIGEILLNYHPSSNGELVRYLEKNGLEAILPNMIDFFRRDLIRVKEGAQRGHLPNGFFQGMLAGLADKLYAHVLAKVGQVHRRFRFFEPSKDVHELASNVDDLIDRTYMVGEGWLIPAEILEHAGHGVKAFVIVQPFGCLPNHITGRGLIKAIKRRHPRIQVVSLDYDPDTSFANVENRLQMLIMTAKALENAPEQNASNEGPSDRPIAE